MWTEVLWDLINSIQKVNSSEWNIEAWPKFDSKMAASIPHIYHERQSKQLCALHVLNNLFQVILFPLLSFHSYFFSILHLKTVFPPSFVSYVDFCSGASIQQTRHGWHLPSTCTRLQFVVESSPISNRARQLRRQRHDGRVARQRLPSCVVWQKKVSADEKILLFPTKTSITFFFLICLIRNLDQLRPSTALGFILNVPSGSRLTNWMPSALVSHKHWIALRKIGDELYFNLNSQLSEPEVIGDVSCDFFLHRNDALWRHRIPKVVDLFLTKLTFF